MIYREGNGITDETDKACVVCDVIKTLMNYARLTDALACHVGLSFDTVVEIIRVESTDTGGF